MSQENEEEVQGEKGLTLALSVKQKVGLPNFGSAEVSLFVSGVKADTTPEEVDALLDNGGKLAYGKMVNRLREQVAKVQRDKMFPPEEGD